MTALGRDGIAIRKTRVSRLCLAIFIAIGSVWFSALPASASSSTTITAQYPWPHNGCTSAPDNPAGASFTYACNHHDGCYARHWADRATCDQWFLNDMMTACRRLPFEMVGNCAGMAYVYYYFVRVKGQPFYDSNGTMVRISTPMRIG
jgi:Prokaryotic phospholipase A2